MAKISEVIAKILGEKDIEVTETTSSTVEQNDSKETSTEPDNKVTETMEDIKKQLEELKNRNKELEKANKDILDHRSIKEHETTVEDDIFNLVNMIKGGAYNGYSNTSTGVERTGTADIPNS